MKYEHYKGGVYEYITTAIHTETGEEMMIYAGTGETKGIWARPKEMFFEDVQGPTSGVVLKGASGNRLILGKHFRDFTFTRDEDSYELRVYIAEGRQESTSPLLSYFGDLAKIDVSRTPAYEYTVHNRAVFMTESSVVFKGDITGIRLSLDYVTGDTIPRFTKVGA